MQTSPIRHRQLLKIAIVLQFMLLTSCSMTTRITATNDCDTFANNPNNKKTAWTFAWGLVQSKDINPNCDQEFNHLNKVTVKNNLAFILLSAVTLGAVVPTRVEWCCAPPNPPTDTLGN